MSKTNYRNPLFWTQSHRPAQPMLMLCVFRKAEEEHKAALKGRGRTRPPHSSIALAMQTQDTTRHKAASPLITRAKPAGENDSDITPIFREY